MSIEIMKKIINKNHTRRNGLSLEHVFRLPSEFRIELKRKLDLHILQCFNTPSRTETKGLITIESQDNKKDYSLLSGGAIMINSNDKIITDNLVSGVSAILIHHQNIIIDSEYCLNQMMGYLPELLPVYAESDSDPTANAITFLLDVLKYNLIDKMVLLEGWSASRPIKSLTLKSAGTGSYLKMKLERYDIDEVFNLKSLQSAKLCDSLLNHDITYTMLEKSENIHDFITFFTELYIEKFRDKTTHKEETSTDFTKAEIDAAIEEVRRLNGGNDNE